jgi:hypothetical protein
MLIAKTLPLMTQITLILTDLAILDRGEEKKTNSSCGMRRGIAWKFRGFPPPFQAFGI